MEHCRNAGKPRQRPWVSSCGLWEAPVEHGGHVTGGMEFSSDGRCVQVEEWMLPGLSRQSEQMCPQSSARTVRW